MLLRQMLWLTVCLSLVGFTACSQPNPPETPLTNPNPIPPGVAESRRAEFPGAIASSPTPSGDLSPLFAKIWRVSEAPFTPAPGSITVFLPNGTLLQTSCVETYSIAGWTADRQVPKRLQVTESDRPVYDAEILELTDSTLRLRLNLIPSNETQEVTYTAVEENFLCPDLPR